MYQNSFSIMVIRRSVTADSLAEALCERLRELRGRNIEIKGDTVCFTGSYLRCVTNWNVLVPITRGEVRIDRDAMVVRYHLTFTGIAIAMPLGVGLTLLMAAINGFPVPVSILVTWFVLLGLGGVGASIAIGIHRFDAFLRRFLREAGFEIVGRN